MLVLLGWGWVQNFFLNRRNNNKRHTVHLLHWGRRQSGGTALWFVGKVPRGLEAMQEAPLETNRGCWGTKDRSPVPCLPDVLG